MNPREPMTWAIFAALVEKQFIEKHLDRETAPLTWLTWDAAAFGGPTPDVYVQVLPEGIAIGED